MDSVHPLFGDIPGVPSVRAPIPGLVVVGPCLVLASGGLRFASCMRMSRVLVADRTGSKADIPARAAPRLPVCGRSIAGGALAVVPGGPGAVVGMWIIAPAGIATHPIGRSRAPACPRMKADGPRLGGPGPDVRPGPGRDRRRLAPLCALCLIAALGVDAIHGTAAAGAARDDVGPARLWAGAGLALLTLLIVHDRITRTAPATDVFVPATAAICILPALGAVLPGIAELPGWLASVAANAPGVEAAVGGGIGAAASAHAPHPAGEGVLQALPTVIPGIVFPGCAVTAGMAAVVSEPLMGVLALGTLLALAMLLPVRPRRHDDDRACLRAGAARPLYHPEAVPDPDIDRSASPGARAAA